jgi:lysozyme family protein
MLAAMQSSLSTAIRFLQQPRIEGGYVDDPADPGGCTNFGITLATYRKHINPRGTCKALRRMPLSVAEVIYRQSYWFAIRGDDLPAGLDLMTFDTCVNSGPDRAVKLLQRALHVTDDSKLGPMTLKAARQAVPADAIAAYGTQRRAYLMRLKIYPRFKGGWEYRVSLCEEWALRLADGRPD